MANKVTTIKTENGCEVSQRVTLYLSNSEYQLILRALMAVSVPDQDTDIELARKDLVKTLPGSDEIRLKNLLTQLI